MKFLINLQHEVHLFIQLCVYFLSHSISFFLSFFLLNICSGFELTSLRFSSQINGKRNPGYPIEQRLRHRVELHERDLRGGAVFQGHVDPSHPRKRGDVQERDRSPR